MLTKIKILLTSLVFVALIGCGNNEAVIDDELANNSFASAKEYELTDGLTLRMPNYTLNMETGALVGENEDISIQCFYIQNIDKIFSDEEISLLLDKHVTSMDDVNAVKYGFMVEALVEQFSMDNNIDVNSYDKEWIEEDNYTCFRLGGLLNEDGKPCDLAFLYDEYSNGVIAFVFVSNEESTEDKDLVKEFFDAIKFTKEFKMKSAYKTELDIVYQTVTKITIDMGQLQ